jgi:hypothetical protein
MNFDFFKTNYQELIPFSEIVNKNIVMCMHGDTSLYWVHTLANDKEFACINKSWLVFYSKKFDLYFFYYRDANNNNWKEELINEVNSISEKNKYIHFILGDGSNIKELITYFDEKPIKNLDYSILNFNSEVLTETEPHDVWSRKNIKYFFSCSNMIAKNEVDNNIAGKWQHTFEDKFIMDYKYAFICFYHKLGFCYFQKGEQGFEVSNRKNKIFLYSKAPNKNMDNPRNVAIQKALSTNKIFDKEYSESDWFWYFANYNYYHIPFINDYNLCKFNLVMETQTPNVFDSPESIATSNQFFSEKTLKALMVSTPAYVLLQYTVYKELKDYGFYFLNEEFGEHIDFSNYDKFCNWFKNASDEDMNKLFEVAYEKSKKNKELVESYIFSDKIKEINLLINS